MLTVHDMGHKPTERNGQDDEHGKVQDVLNCSAHDLRITPHENIDVIDKEPDAGDSYNGNENVHSPPLSLTMAFSSARLRKRLMIVNAFGN